MSTFFSIWFDRIVPLMGRFDDAYTYLPASVKRFPGPEPLAAELVAAGCKDVGWILTAGGIIALHHGTVRDSGERRGGRRGRRGWGRARPWADGRARRTGCASVAGSHGAKLGEHARATIEAGGKRLRPLLVFVAAGPAAAGHDAALRAAVAVELVHSATLVHDDVLDAAVLRRGRPTVVAAAGRSIATATGDLLFSRAFAELAGGGSARRGARAVGRFLRARAG